MSNITSITSARSVETSLYAALRATEAIARTDRNEPLANLLCALERGYRIMNRCHSYTDEDAADLDRLAADVESLGAEIAAQMQALEYEISTMHGGGDNAA